MQDLHETGMGTSTLGLGYKIFILNTDISLKVRDSLKNWFPPHLSVYTDYWQQEAWVFSCLTPFFYLFIFN